MAEASFAEGVTHIVCTPHANDRYPFQPEVNRQRVAMLNERLGGRVTLGLGCDFHLSYENIKNFTVDRTRFTINNKQYLLVEFPDFGIPPSIGDTFYEMTLLGTVPIITHPERNPTLLAEPQRMAEWLQGGCLVQVTAGSLIGRFGRRSEAMARELIKKNWVHFIASDAHSVDRRPPAMGSAYRLLQRDYGQETADRLCVQNPRAAFLGEAMPWQAEPEGIFEELKAEKKSFFGRIFGR